MVRDVPRELIRVLRIPIRHLRMFFAASSAAVLLLTACAPSPGLDPSPALQEQLEQLRRQQQEQADELQALRQQVQELRQAPRRTETVTAELPAPEPAVPSSPLIVEGPAEPPAVVAPDQAPTTQFTTAGSVADLEASASSYLTAFSSLAAGQWPEAERGFADFLNTFPEHRYAPNARYWLATAQLEQDKTTAAMSSLRRIIVNPRGTSRAPAALAQLARLYQQQQEPLRAAEVLEQLQRRFPDSPEAQRL